MPPKNALKYEDDFLRDILSTTKTIAMIGLSPDDNRPSNFAAKYLQMKGSFSNSNFQDPFVKNKMHEDPTKIGKCLLLT